MSTKELKFEFSQPESFEGLSYDPDEIPGISTFIYRENRLRKPHEYVGYEEHENNLNKLATELNISPHEVIDYLTSKIETYKQLADEAEFQRADKQNTINQLSKQITEYRTCVNNQRYDIDTLRKSVAKQEDKLDKLDESILKYGTHTIECNWTDMVSNGRVHGEEDEMCDCGWMELKEETLKYIKK